MPSQWILSYAVVDEAMQHRCRLDFELLRRDPNVESVLFGTPPQDGDIRLLQVNFKEGRERPQTASVMFLDRVLGLQHPDIERNAYPTISENDQIVVDMQALGDLDDARRAIHSKGEAGKPLLLSPEFSSTEAWKKALPEWCYPGAWIVEKTSDMIFEVLKINPGISPTVTIQEWRHFTPYVISTHGIRDLFKLGRKPRDPDTWQMRVMEEDAF